LQDSDGVPPQTKMEMIASHHLTPKGWNSGSQSLGQFKGTEQILCMATLVETH
jgi:hypothetical protein